MTEQDFSLRSITRINSKMITDTGAKLESVDAEVISKLNRVCNLLGADPCLQKNGLTTGSHASDMHPRGQAVDFYFIKEFPFKDVFKAMLKVGFTGVGVYHNGKMYSYHGDLRQGYSFWTGKKSEVGELWEYGELLNDPGKGGSK
jgi:hypothetical protein